MPSRMQEICCAQQGKVLFFLIFLSSRVGHTELELHRMSCALVAF